MSIIRLLVNVSANGMASRLGFFAVPPTTVNMDIVTLTQGLRCTSTGSLADSKLILGSNTIVSIGGSTQTANLMDTLILTYYTSYPNIIMTYGRVCLVI